jgi:hypothetical protein
MRVVDELLEDEDLLEAVYEAQGKWHPHGRTHGRSGREIDPESGGEGGGVWARLDGKAVTTVSGLELEHTGPCSDLGPAKRK